jgi:hypothetical protein
MNLTSPEPQQALPAEALPMMNAYSFPSARASPSSSIVYRQPGASTSLPAGLCTCVAIAPPPEMVPNFRQYTNRTRFWK